jgi:hypothetical protein
MKKTLLLTMILALGCSDPFGEAKELNTVEAYDKFITENSSSSRVFDARMAIEKIMTDKARETQNPADFDAYIKKFKGNPPTKSLYNKMVEERKSAAWDQAVDSNKPADWEKFIEEYKTKDAKMSNRAKARLTVAKYLPNLKIDPIEKTQINLSGDKSGPLDGWEFSTTVTNNGDKEIERLILRIVFMNSDGMIAGAQNYTVIGCGDYCNRKHLFEEKNPHPEIARIKPPFLPGKERIFLESTGDIPPDWSKQIKAEFVTIEFVDDKKKIIFGH